jgi:methionyl-tRNA synthetase
MTARYLAGDRPSPAALGDSSLAAAWQSTWPQYGDRIERYLLHEALAVLWEFVGEANRFVDREQPWVLAREAGAGNEEAASRLQATLGDLLEACRVLALAAAPFMPAVAARVFAQLGLQYAYAADGNGGPVLSEQVVWGESPVGGRVGDQEILFPRVEIGES